MSTTFERVAKIIKEETAPANAVESAFASLATGGDVPEPATATPEDLGTAAVGTSLKYAREDHVHDMPSPSDVGAIASPASPTSGQLLYYNGMAWVAVDNPTDEQIASAVDDWCGDNLAQETGYVLDSTLSMSNAAAPADKVGDLKSAIEATFTDKNIWSDGTIAIADGAFQTTNAHIRTNLPISRDILSVTPANGYKVAAAVWDSDNTYKGRWNGSTFSKTTTVWFETVLDLTKLDRSYVVRLLCAKVDGSSIARDKYDKFVLTAATDKTLTQSGKSADAKATGDAVGDRVAAFTNVPYSISGKRIKTNGDIVGQTNSYITDYYPCKAGTKVEFCGLSFIYQGSPTSSLIAFYNVNKTFISGITSINNETVTSWGKVSATAPEGTAFVAFCTQNETSATRDKYARVFDVIPVTDKLFSEEITNAVENARHIKYNTGTPLTLLHFSDIHADAAALTRIIKKASNYDVLIQDKICTGDMTANTSGQISSWWDEDVMTCIGNHDTASYSGGAYNWTALSMADRDTYYIAPFESNWSITHTSGTSYYYKDYAAQKVRLIVMDAMLYTGTPGEEAAAQNLWLGNLMADAITNNLHVLIAIHTAHGGATAKDCSFSRYGASTFPTRADCNVPQSIVDAVATKITAGMKFIGYICGHTHQDGIWDAENNGKQLFYTVTCANTAQTDQWKNSDQDRAHEQDAFNIVTIDTENTLVKIIRGGGADIDDHMRTRKAICFDYSTGTKVGEIL